MQLVEQEVAARIEQATMETLPIRILEVGAGPSIPHSSFYGAPWLSRILAASYPGRVDVISMHNGIFKGGFILCPLWINMYPLSISG